MKFTLDAPYYAGTIVVASDNVIAIHWGDNGGATLVLRGGGTLRVVNNDQTFRN